ncbi:hypothetical protein MLD38_030394 [Melastoma candidum]|uniref:Uncharacterized protein n=1 Tax=Melastoma candidum TaxID=119954 RepID=A0ACB9MLL7_9MYRT|nr:hypothetical protein MLD38_030394 [Melastoma candidum]
MALLGFGRPSDPANVNPTAEEDPGKNVQKPYTITKSRESWTDLEHDKFLEAPMDFNLPLLCVGRRRLLLTNEIDSGTVIENSGQDDLCCDGPESRSLQKMHIQDPLGYHYFPFGRNPSLCGRPSSGREFKGVRNPRSRQKMIIPEKNRREISKYLFQEGVCYAKKDYNLAKHPEIDVPNLQVIKLMQSFKSKEYVRETFAWMHYYWFLTNDGIEFLRTYLNLPSEIVPATLKKQAKPLGRPMGGPPGDRPRGPPRFDGDRPRFGDREGYRGGPRGGGDFGGDKGGAPADFQPSFRGTGGRPGFGRGSGSYGAPSSGSGFT